MGEGYSLLRGLVTAIPLTVYARAARPLTLGVRWAEPTRLLAVGLLGIGEGAAAAWRNRRAAADDAFGRQAWLGNHMTKPPDGLDAGWRPRLDPLVMLAILSRC